VAEQHVIDWWAGTAGVLIGTILGSAIPLWHEWNARRLERRGDIASIQTELMLCQRMLNALMTEGIAAPLYRVPTSATARALPKLIAEGEFTLNEQAALIEYLNRVEELNRGLERAGAAHAADKVGLLGEEATRNLQKAEGLLRSEVRFQNRSLYVAASDAVYDLDLDYLPVEIFLSWDGLPMVLHLPRIWGAARD
jgi:hypothetical protein